MAHRGVTEQDVVTGVAAEDLRPYRFHAVRRDADGYRLAREGDEVAGILDNAPNTGAVASVLVGGYHEAVVLPPVWPGTPLTPDAEGRLVQVEGEARYFYEGAEKSFMGGVFTVRRVAASVGG